MKRGGFINTFFSLKKKISILSLFFLILIFDQLSKAMIQKYIPIEGTRIHVLGNFFNLVYIKNPYGAMGMRYGPPWLHMVTAALATLIVGFFFFKHWINGKERNMLSYVGMVMVLSGAVGNLIDKIFRGFVVDFIDIGFSTHRFWSFNIADSAITIGAVLWIIPSIIPSKKSGEHCEEKVE